MNTSLRRSLASIALALAGAAFVLYPALRPYADETTLAGLAAMASNRWVIAHSLGIIAFILLGFGLRAMVVLHETRSTSRTAALAGVLAWLGGSLVLPYYGAEAFGLQVIGARAVAEQDVSLLQSVDAFRYGAFPMTFFAAGLLLLAAAGVALAISLRHSPAPARIAGILLGLGLVGYLPQFFGSPVIRIGHGLVLATGCLLLAVNVQRNAILDPETEGDPSMRTRHADRMRT